MTIYDDVIVSPVLQISTAQVIDFVQEHVLTLISVGKKEFCYRKTRYYMYNIAKNVHYYAEDSEKVISGASSKAELKQCICQCCYTVSRGISVVSKSRLQAVTSPVYVLWYFFSFYN